LHLKGGPIFVWPGQIPNSNSYLLPKDVLPEAGLQIYLNETNKNTYLILRDSQGKEFSICQIGKTDYNVVFSFQIHTLSLSNLIQQ
jgi:hypothetical protein